MVDSFKKSSSIREVENFLKTSSHGTKTYLKDVCNNKYKIRSESLITRKSVRWLLILPSTNTHLKKWFVTIAEIGANKSKCVYPIFWTDIYLKQIPEKQTTI